MMKSTQDSKTRTVHNLDHKSDINQASFMQTRKIACLKNNSAEQIQTDAE